MTNAPPPLAGYGLLYPTEAHARRALERVMGPAAEELWSGARARAGYASAPTLDLPALKHVVEALRQQGGAPAVCAMSMAVRIATYEMLRDRNYPAARKVSP